MAQLEHHLIDGREDKFTGRERLLDRSKILKINDLG